MKKKIFIGIGSIVAIIVAIIAFMVVSDLKQESKLKEEMAYIDELVNKENVDKDEVNKVLERTTTKKDYQVVEKAYKNYLKDCFDNMLKIADILQDERITKSLTAENYKEDGPNFTQTKEYLLKTKSQLEEYKTKYAEFFTEEKAMSYINDKGLDSYYTDLYKNEIIGDIEKEGEDKTVENSINDIIEMLHTSEDVINFLSTNRNSWSIEDDNIVFTKDSLANKYDELISRLQ